MELQDYWRTIRRRWRLVVSTVLLVVAFAAVWTWTTTPLYSSTTRIFIDHLIFGTPPGPDLYT